MVVIEVNVCEQVQPYRDISTMTKEEGLKYIQKPHMTEYGFIITNNFDSNGKTITEITTEYFRKILNKLD